MIKMRRVVTTLAVTAMCLLAPVQNVSAAESNNSGTHGDGQTYTQDYTLEVQGEDAVLGASYRTDFSKEIDAEKVTDVNFCKIDGKLVMTYKVKIEAASGSGWRSSMYYDENGDSVSCSSKNSTKSGGYNIFSVVFDDDVKTGDKIVLYSYLNTYNSETYTTDYTDEIVKFVTVKDAKEWTGSVSDYTAYAGSDTGSHYLNAYIPGNLQLSDKAYLAVYSGDKMVAKSLGVLSKHSSSGSTYVDGVYVYVGSSFSAYNISCSVYPAKALAAGKYSVKLVDGDKVYDFGERFTVTDEKSVSSAYTTSGYRSSAPVIYVTTRGYTGDELLVELTDKDGNVVATSNGGEYMTSASSSSSYNEYYYKLKSDYKLDEINKMSGLNIVVKSLDGTELLSNGYSNSYGIQRMYYDYYDDCVYAATYGIADGTVVTASLSADGVTYETEAAVNDGRAFFYFAENGQKLDLTSKIPDGKRSEYFDMKLSWKDGDSNRTSGRSVNVQDYNRSSSSTYNTSNIESWYPVGTTSITAAVDISTSNLKDIELQKGTTFTFRISTSSYSSSSEYSKSEEVNAVVTPISKTYSSGEVAGFNFKADIPVEALEAGNYYVILTARNGGTTYTRSYSFRVADLSYMYSSVRMTSFTGKDTPYVYVSVPSYMRDTADVSRLTLNITDVLGNKTDVQLTYDADKSGKTYWYFAATGVDKDANYYITANYDGKPVYSTEDSGLKREEAASAKGRFYFSNNAYFTYIRTFKKDNSKEYMEESQLYKVTCYSDDLTLEIREAGRFDLLKTMALKKGYNYFTEDFLAGLSYDKLQFQYELRVVNKDGRYITNTTDYLASSSKAYEPFEDKKDDTDTKLSGIVLAGDGNYYYYINGAVATSFTGLATNDMGTFYFVNGKLDFSFNGFVNQNDTWWCVAGGRVCPDYTGLWSDATVGWWYVKDGKIDFSFNGLVPFGDAWWCVAGGRVCFEYTGLWSDANVGWWYVENGAINFGFNGYVPFGDAWWCVAGGRVCFEYTGLWSDANVGWWYTENGAINFGFNGLVPFGDAWWCVAGGRVCFEYTGLWNDANVGWWYVENGVINFGFNGAVDYNGGTYNVAGGMVVFG